MGAKTRKVVERASSKPPPRAREERAVMEGMGRLEMSRRVRRRFVRKARTLWVLVLRHEQKGKKGSLRLRHAPPLLQIRPSAKHALDLTRQHQRSHPSRRQGTCVAGVADECDFGGELGEEAKGDGVAIVGGREGEDADGAGVGGGEVGYAEEGGGGGEGAGDVGMGETGEREGEAGGHGWW